MSCQDAVGHAVKVSREFNNTSLADSRRVMTARFSAVFFWEKLAHGDISFRANYGLRQVMLLFSSFSLHARFLFS